jgi:hypothetical protein
MPEWGWGRWQIVAYGNKLIMVRPYISFLISMHLYLKMYFIYLLCVLIITLFI